MALEAFPHDGADVARLAHSVEMHGRDTVPEEVGALCGTPFRADFIDRLLVPASLRNLFGELPGNVQGEGLREKFHLLCR